MLCSKDAHYEELNASIALAAAFFEQTGLRELIDSKFDTDVRQKLSPGNAVKALIGDMVGTKGRMTASSSKGRISSSTSSWTQSRHSDWTRIISSIDIPDRTQSKDRAAEAMARLRKSKMKCRIHVQRNERSAAYREPASPDPRR